MSSQGIATMPIFDQGYQHWQGPLAGHGWRWLAIARHGVRVQVKNRILRLLLLCAWMPALALVVAVAVWGLVEQRNQSVLPLAGFFLPAEFLRDPIAHRATVWTIFYSIFFQVEMFVIMLLIVIAGPGLISRDLRFNALPLYFARPLTRLDYFLGKLGVIGALVGAVAVGPAVIAYALGVCFSLDLGVVKDTYGVLLASVAYGLVITLSTGTLILALSSLTRRSLYVGIAWAGLWLISWSVGTIMTGIHHDSLRRALHQEEMAHWLDKHPPPPGVQMHGSYPIRKWRERPARKVRQDDLQEPHQPGRRTRHSAKPVQREGRDHVDDFGPMTEEDRWFQAYDQAYRLAMLQTQIRVAEELREDWRPLCSYVANLGRISDLLLDTDTAWVEVGKASPRSQGEERRFANEMVPQYPWWWSAAVLAGLMGISTWTLTRRVKSLDRLR
jgi:ABC-2 type transport system permease protein